MNIGDRVFLNDPRNISTGQPGTIEGIDHSKSYPYLFRLDGDRFAYWFPSDKLSITRPIVGYSPERNTVYRQSQNTVQDFDRGFGIGGLSRHSADEGLAELVASGKMSYREPTGNKMPSGQLWEPCPRCGDEPVCLDCGYCEKHCVC